MFSIQKTITPQVATKLMPYYVYSCKNCEETLEIWHSMSEKKKDCPSCGSIDSLFKVPSFSKTSFDSNKKQKVGSVVDKYIEDTKRDVLKEKEDLKKREL